jgi:hypothetical protein
MFRRRRGVSTILMVSKVGRVVSTILVVSTHVSKPVIDSAYEPVRTMAGGPKDSFLLYLLMGGTLTRIGLRVLSHSVVELLIYCLLNAIGFLVDMIFLILHPTLDI